MKNERKTALAMSLAIASAVVLLAFRPTGNAQQVADAPRPSRITLSCPGRIDQALGFNSESYFAVDFDRLPGIPGSTRSMRVTWYCLPQDGDTWAVLLGADSQAPLACLTAAEGQHKAVVKYQKPEGVDVIRLSPQPVGCGGIGGFAWGVVIELD